jgi:hypothetical protein
MFNRKKGEPCTHFKNRTWCDIICKREKKRLNVRTKHIKITEKEIKDCKCRKCGESFKSRVNRSLCYNPICYRKNFDKKIRAGVEWSSTEKKNMCALESFRKKALGLGISSKEAAIVSMEVIRKCNINHGFKDWDEEEIKDIRRKVEEANELS